MARFHPVSPVAVLLALPFLLAGVTGCGNGDRQAEAKTIPIPIRVRVPKKVNQAASVQASGAVEARATEQPAFQVPGRVARVLVQEGQAVGPGHVLAELDSTEYRYAAEAARAQSAAARAAFDKAQSAVRRQELEQARIDFDRWDDEHRRMRMLYERKSLPLNDYKKVEAAWQAARQRYELASEGARHEDREASRALLDQASAQEQVQRKRLADTRLLTLTGGSVARRMVDPGNMVAAGQPVFVIMALDPVRVSIAVPEAEIGGIRPGLPVTVQIPALPDFRVSGKVELVGVAADPASRTYTIKALVPNPKRMLLAGMIAEARIETERRIQALTVPIEALVRDPRGTTLVYVFYPEKQRVFARRVETGEAVGREIAIKSGLGGSEPVVVAGQHLVREGSLVEVAGGVR